MCLCNGPLLKGEEMISTAAGNVVLLLCVNLFLLRLSRFLPCFVMEVVYSFDRSSCLYACDGFGVILEFQPVSLMLLVFDFMGLGSGD